MGRIAEFFSGKSIFITGATGFLGQPLVEKILWAAPDVARIYLLIRPKRQFGGRVLTPQQRIEKELFQSSSFDRLYSRHGDRIQSFLEERLAAVSGDISQPDLGIDEGLRSHLREELDIVINSAAVVSFDAPLDEALELNVFGAQRLARFANSCHKAQLVHVSTAYVCGNSEVPVEETLYHSANGSEPFPQRAFSDVTRDIEKIKSKVEEVQRQAHSEEVDRELKKVLVERSRKGKSRLVNRRGILEKLRRQWLRDRMTQAGMQWARERGWNDTYTYTKAMGEQVVVAERGGKPLVIVRPSVIESSVSEPSPGWLDGLRMADPLIAAIGKGRLKSLPLNPEVVLDLVPVDIVVNTLLAAIPRAGNGELQIYQVATGSRNPISLGTLYDLIYRYFANNPMLDRSGRPIRIKRLKFKTPKQFRFQHKLRSRPLKSAERTLDRLAVFDGTHKIKRRISAIRVANEKLYYYGEIYEPYLNLDCRFKIDNTMSLWESLSEEDQLCFNFDVTRLNWRYYIQNVHIPGVKKFILKVEGAGTLSVMDPKDSEPLKDLTIPYLLRRAARKFPAKTALQIQRSGEWQGYTYSELLEATGRVAQRFQRYGFQKGDRVVLYSENQPEWGVSYLGAVTAGLVVVPIDSQTWHREAWSVAGYTEARAILASASCLKRLGRSGWDENESSEKPVLLLDVNQECAPFELADCPRGTTPEEREIVGDVEVGPDDPASIIFTTGTSVDPRGAVHSHQNFINNLLGVHHYLPIYESDHMISVLPLYHALAFSCGFLMPIYGGATVSYAHSLKPRVLLENIREVGATCLLGVPTLFLLIRDDIERRVLKTSKSKVKSNIHTTSKQFSRTIEKRLGTNIGKALFSKIHQEFGGKMRVVVSGGSALGEQLFDDYKALGLPIYEGYGLTETAPVLTVSPLKRSRRGSAGKALPGVELRLSNPDEEGVGEIIVRTSSLMKGYWKNDEATRRVIQDGWFHTGDLGWVDADGYVYITGRIKDVIVTGAGKNVYPIDLEAIYKALPGVGDICVAGVRSGLTEEIHALIVPDSDPGEAADDPKALQNRIQKLGRELPSYHRLQAIHMMSEPLPRDEEGRLQREEVAEKLRTILKQKGSRAAPPSQAAKGSTDRELILAELSRLSGVPVGDIKPSSDLYSDLGMDSLMAIELLLFMDNRFAVTIPDERAAAISTAGEILREVRLSRKGAPPSAGERSRKPISALPYSERSPLDRMLLGATISSIKNFYDCYFDLELFNAKALPNDSAYILAANHSSHLDFAAIFSALKSASGAIEARKLHILGARDYFFDNSLKGWISSSFLNIVPIERVEASLAGLRMVRSILSTGEPVLIFPEGSRSRSGSLQGFKPGLGLIALEMNVPIVPVYIDGTHQALPVGKFIPKRTKIRVFFGAPILAENYQNGAGRPKDELYRQIAADVREAVAALGEARSASAG